MLMMASVHFRGQGVHTSSIMSCGSQNQQFWKFIISFWQQTKFDWYIEVGAFLPLFFFRQTKIWVFLLTTNFETRLSRGFFGTCGKDTAPMQVSIRIQNEVFSESLHFLLTVRLRRSAVEIAGTGPSKVTKTFAEPVASCVERPILARELFVTHCSVRPVSQNAYNREI